MKNENKKNILIIGFGDLAYKVLNILYLDANQYSFSIISRDKQKTLPFVNLIRYTGANLGKFKSVNLFENDLENEEKTAALINEIKPDLIFNTTSIQSWRELTKLPPQVFQELDKAQLGPWLPLHLSPMLHLMKSVRLADYKGPVVNAAFPDAVNPVLGRIGLAPTSGIGNCANIIPALRHSIAKLEDVGVEDVQLKLVTQHFLSHHAPGNGNTGNAPYGCWVTIENRYVDKKIELNESVLKPLTNEFKRVGGVLGQHLTASSAISVITGFLFTNPSTAHAPGVNGLVGGYPVRFENGKIELNLPSDVSISEAESINNACQVFDGIETIKANGDVVFTDKHMKIMNTLISYDQKEIHLSDTHEIAKELRSKYLSFVNNL